MAALYCTCDTLIERQVKDRGEEGRRTAIAFVLEPRVHLEHELEQNVDEQPDDEQPERPLGQNHLVELEAEEQVGHRLKIMY